MISKTLKVSLLIIALGSISFVNAQDEKRKNKHNPEELFKKLDANNDDSLSLEEFKGKRQRKDREEIIGNNFKELDADANGSLSLEEFTSRKKLSKEERIEKHFAKMDANGDGNVNLSEYKAFIEKVKSHRKKRKPRRHKKDR